MPREEGCCRLLARSMHLWVIILLVVTFIYNY
jgi:hypothetical protein